MKRYIKSTDDIVYTEDNLKMYEALVKSRYANWVAAVSCKHPNPTQVAQAESKLDEALSKLEEVEQYIGVTSNIKDTIEEYRS